MKLGGGKDFSVGVFFFAVVVSQAGYLGKSRGDEALIRARDETKLGHYVYKEVYGVNQSNLSC